MQFCPSVDCNRFLGSISLEIFGMSIANTFKNEIRVDRFAVRTITLVVLLMKRIEIYLLMVQPGPVEREHFKRYLFLHQLRLSVMDCSSSAQY